MAVGAEVEPRPSQLGVSGRTGGGGAWLRDREFLEGGNFPGRCSGELPSEPVGGRLGVGREDDEPVTAVFLACGTRGSSWAPACASGPAHGRTGLSGGAPAPR